MARPLDSATPGSPTCTVSGSPGFVRVGLHTLSTSCRCVWNTVCTNVARLRDFSLRRRCYNTKIIIYTRCLRSDRSVWFLRRSFACFFTALRHIRDAQRIAEARRSCISFECDYLLLELGAFGFQLLAGTLRARHVSSQPPDVSRTRTDTMHRMSCDCVWP